MAQGNSIHEDRLDAHVNADGSTPLYATIQRQVGGASVHTEPVPAYEPVPEPPLKG